jgi:hypothetical protein
MAAPPRDRLTDLAELPRAGTAVRREWDQTIRLANELYPDWAWIRIGAARFRREAYEQRGKPYDTEPDRRRRRGAGDAVGLTGAK